MCLFLFSTHFACDFFTGSFSYLDTEVPLLLRTLSVSVGTFFSIAFCLFFIFLKSLLETKPTAYEDTLGRDSTTELQLCQHSPYKPLDLVCFLALNTVSMLTTHKKASSLSLLCGFICVTLSCLLHAYPYVIQ